MISNDFIHFIWKYYPHTSSFVLYPKFGAKSIVDIEETDTKQSSSNIKKNLI